MEFGDSVLEGIDEELSLEDGDDVEMMDVEEGEVVDGKTVQGNESQGNKQPHSEDSQHTNNINKGKKNKKRKKNKKKKKGVPGSSAVNVDRFVLDVCKRLREKKSYLVYTAVGVLGVSALSDLVKEVDAVQACGGQMTADGYRSRTGGGVLWNILKVRDPNAYKEIMKKGKEFEKQFRQPRVGQAPMQNDNVAQRAGREVPSKAAEDIPDDDSNLRTVESEEPIQPLAEGKRRSIHERIRVPVSYDDLPGEESQKGSISQK